MGFVNPWASDSGRATLFDLRLPLLTYYLPLTLGVMGSAHGFLLSWPLTLGVWDPLMVEALAKEGCRAILVDGPVLLVAFGLQPLI